MQKQKLPTYSKKDAAAVASSTEKQGAAAARGGGEPTSFFMSLLHRAGKPRSLTMNEFDLPENYGIVDRSFRTKAMAHSKFVGGGSHNNSNNNNKIRSSSSSNALSQKGGPEQPTLPLLLVSTVETRFHSTVYEEEKEQPSSVRRVGGGLPSVASDADTRLPSPIGSSAATAAAAGSVECCASPLPSEGPPPPAETATHHTVAASSNVQSLPPSQCADLSLLTVAGLNESLDRNGLMFGSPSAHKLLHDSWNVTSAHSDGSEGVGGASTPPLPISSKTRLALCGGIRAGSPRKRVAPLLPLTELNVALHRPEPRDARTGLSLLWQLREVLTHEWIAQLDLDPTANLSDDEGMTDLLCSASFRAHAADAASRQHQQQQRSRSPHGSFVRVNSLRGASTDLSAADNDGGGGAIETVTSQPFDAERIPPIRNPFEGVPPTDPMASLVQTLHAAPFHWLDLTNAGFSPSTKIATSKSNNEDGGGASEAHPLPASQQGASTTLAEALFNTSTTSSAAAPSVPVVENENNMNSNPLVVPEPSSYQLAKLHLPSTALESIQHKERLRRAALLGHTNPFHSTGDDAGGRGGDIDQPLLLEQQPNARKISSNGIIQVKYGSGANSQESGIQRSTNSLLATPSALPSWASSLLATIPVASGGGSNSATPWNTLFQYFLNTMASSGSAADRSVAFQRLCDLHRAFCSYCGTYVASHFFETIGPNIQLEAAGVFFSLVTVEADGEEFACNKPSPAAAQADASGRSPTHLNRTLSHNTFDEGTSNSGKYDEESSTDGEGNNSVGRGEHGAPAGGGSGSDPPVHSICAAQRKICGHETRWISHLSEMWWKDLAAHQDAFRRSSYATMDQVTLLAPLAPPAAIATKIDPSLSRSVLFPLFCSVNIYGHTVACTAVISAASNVSMATPVQTSLRSTSLVRRAALEGGLSPYFLSADDHPESFPLKKFDIVDSSVGIQYGCCPTATASGKSQCQNPHCICRYVLSGVTAFPPLIPTLQYCPLVRLRPQFTRTLTDMLPADTFSANVTFAEKQNAQSMAVKVTRRLMHKTIAELVHSFELSWSSPKLRDPQSLANLLQHRGVNMCFLGYLGDSLFTKLRSFQAVKNSGMIPTDDGGVDEYGLTIDHHMDGLRKALASVKEEMAVRAFRVHWNDALRKQADVFLAQHASASSSSSSGNSGGEPSRPRTGKQWLEDSIAMTTSMVKAFLGVESDTRTATMWVSVILPYIRSYFHFRAPMSRKDVEISSVVRRLQHLCGIVMTPASPADAVNKSALHRHETILSLTLRTARACALGNVVELRPYVKSPSPPQLPPLASLNDVGLPRTKNALMEVHRSRSGQGLTPFLHHLESRLAEVLFFENEEQRTEAPDEVMLKRIVRYQNFFVPLLAEAVECCTDLAGMLLQGRRCPDAFRCAEDALNVASTLPYGIVNPAITVLVCIAVTAARESGNRESAVHATERAVVTVVRRLTVLVEDPLNYLRKSDGLDGPRPSIERERDILRSLVDALVDAYKAISYHTLIQPLPFHDTVVSIQMLQLMCVIAERDLAKGASPRDVGAVVARAADLAEVLLCRTTEASQSCVVEALKQNLKTLVPSNE